MNDSPVTSFIQSRTLSSLQKMYMRVLCSALILLSGVGIVALYYGAAQRGTAVNTIGLAVQVGMIIFASIVLILIDRERIRLSARLLIYCVSAAAIITIFTTYTSGTLLVEQVLTGPYLIIGTLALITNAVLGRRWDYALSTVLVIGAAIAVVVFALQGANSASTQAGLSYIFIVLATQILVSASLRFFVEAIRSTALTTQRVNTLLEGSAAVGQALSRYLDTNELFQRAVDIIRDRFGYYHVQIFVVDEAERHAELKASTGEIGKEMLQRQHKLAVGSRSVIGRVTQIKEIIITDNARQDEFHAFNDLLPDTRSEIAVPIMDGDELIGALDVQSLRPNAFNLPEQQALTVIASQLAVAIRNARLFQQQQQSVQENQLLYEKAEENLNEIKRLNSQLTRDTWQEYVVGRQRLTGVTLQGDRFAPGADWTDAMTQAAQLRQVIVEELDQQRIVAVPISLREQVIGAIEVETGASISQLEVVEMVQAIAQRLAISLDNARLFEETQEASVNEQVISDMVTEFQSTTSLQELLQAALQGLTDTLGASTSAIRLSKVPGQADYITVGALNGSSNGNHNGHNGNGATNGNGHHTRLDGDSHTGSDGDTA
jgi:GAF domain-containing protein